MSHHQPDPSINIHLRIDGLPVTVPEGTTILEAAKKVNVNIPTLCHHPDLCKRAVCRLCVVECDGRGKLAAACANDVWEGLSVVTNNLRIMNIRKTIVELLLANHPQGCLTCARNKNCELQSLAELLGIRFLSFRQDGEEDKPPMIESETLVRDMGKCIKCGRCVEACQEVQTIRAINSSHRSYKYEICTPYKQALSEGPCTFCGQCAAVCPVGAIYEHDQSAEVASLLNKSGRQTMAQISPSLAKPLNDELGFSEGTVTAGKMISALKQLKFDKVYDSAIADNLCISEQYAEFQLRIKTGGLIPMLTGYSAGLANFINYFYPDLSGHLSKGKNPRQTFAALVKEDSAQKTTSVSFVSVIAQKYNAANSAPDKTDFALSVKELARMIKMAGLDMASLQETPFDNINIDLPKQDGTIKKETVYGYADARKALDAVRKGACTAQWIEIHS
jgi:ferredoxin